MSPCRWLSSGDGGRNARAMRSPWLATVCRTFSAVQRRHAHRHLAISLQRVAQLMEQEGLHYIRVAPTDGTVWV